MVALPYCIPTRVFPLKESSAAVGMANEYGNTYNFTQLRMQFEGTGDSIPFQLQVNGENKKNENKTKQKQNITESLKYKY